MMPTTKYGTNEIGPVRYGDRVWYRVDTYTRTDTGAVISERRFALNRNDQSEMFIEGVNGKYDSRCACCYLGFSHTAAYHAAVGSDH